MHVASLGALLAASCVPREQASFQAIGPANRLDAIVLASDDRGDESLRGLIQELDSDDSAARLLAIRALQKRTGQTLDYRHDDPPWRRGQAVTRWVAWASLPAGERGSDQPVQEGQ